MSRRLFSVLMIAGLPLLAPAQSPLDELSEAGLAEGEKAYKVHCARCHGIEGGGGEGSNLVRAKLKYATDDQALIDLLGDGIPGTGMPAIWTLDEQKRMQVAGYVRSLGQLEPEEMPGDPVRGKQLYQTSGGCPACHIIAGRGIGIGPELTYVGDQRGLDYLRQSVAEPAVAQPQTAGFRDYLTVRVESLQGRVEGMRINEDAFTLQVRDLSGTIHSFRKDELTKFEKVFTHSLMPEYGAVLSGRDVDDVVSYLMSLKSN